MHRIRHKEGGAASRRLASRAPLRRLAASLAAVTLLGAVPAIASATSVITISGATAPYGLVFYPIAKYAICVVTNKSNTLSNLTEAQVQAIFTGRDREWSQVPGATATGPIDIISRTSTAGVLTNFKTLFLANKSVSKLAAEEPSEGLLEQQVQNPPGAIGFLSNYRADNGLVNPVGFNGVACNLANATSGQYSAVARFYEVTKGPATGAASKFISWIDTSKAAKKIISSEWIPLSEAPR